MSSVLSRANRNGTTLEVSRFGFGQIEEVANKLNNGYINRFRYAWDSRGLLKYEERVQESKGDAYQYDSLYRLRNVIRDSANVANVDWNNPGSIAHDYKRDFQLDDDHHRSQVTTTPYQGTATTVSYTTDPNRHHYTNVGGTARTFDANGNLTTYGTRAYTYDLTDDLVTVKNGTSTIASYAYDAFGRRASKTVGNVTTRYVYAGPWILEEYRKEGVNPEQLDAVHYHGSGVDDVVMSLRRDRADLDQDQNSTEMIELWHHASRLGSTMELTLSTGVIVESYRYEAFGKPTIRDRQGQLVSAAPSGNPFLFTGREYDSETGLYHYRARTYDPETGGFLQEDPLGMQDDLNPVSYALSNPLSWVDPMGTLSVGEAFSGLMDFLSNNAAGLALDAIPFFREIVDILSALSGRDITAWAEGGFKGKPASMGWWKRIKKGAVAAVFLAGSAIGIVAKFARILKRLKKAKKAKKAEEAAEAARNAARKVAKGGCFTAGMRVALACGCFIPIQDIQVGDRVLAEIPAAVATDKPERGAFLVTATSMRIFDGAIHEITVEDAAGKRDIIRGTPEHPVWSPETRHWVALADLRTGQRLQGAKGPIRVVSRQIRFARLPVFNLGVGGAHSYRIGKLSILVHNNPCDAAGDGLSSLGRAGKGKGVRVVVGDEGDARKLFDGLRGSNPVTEVKAGVFTAPGKNGGTVTFRATSKSGPPTVDVHGIEEGIRKIKFVDQ